MAQTQRERIGMMTQKKWRVVTTQGAFIVFASSAAKAAAPFKRRRMVVVDTHEMRYTPPSRRVVSGA